MYQVTTLLFIHTTRVGRTRSGNVKAMWFVVDTIITWFWEFQVLTLQRIKHQLIRLQNNISNQFDLANMYYETVIAYSTLLNADETCYWHTRTCRFKLIGYLVYLVNFVQCSDSFMHFFIHFGHFYSAPSSPLQLNDIALTETNNMPSRFFITNRFLVGGCWEHPWH